MSRREIASAIARLLGALLLGSIGVAGMLGVAALLFLGCR